MIEYLDLEDALILVHDLGIGPMRDVGLLDSSLHRPRASVFGEDAYPSIIGKAAVLLESIVRNHALVDGNKRLGWLATVVFLGLNGVVLNAPDDDAYEMVVALAAGTLTHQEAADLQGGWM